MDRSDAPAIRVGDDVLTAWFEDSVTGAAENQGIDLDPHMRAYLVNLLTSFAARGALRTDEDQDLLDQPVGLEVVRAMQVDPARRFRKLRHIGDYTLYLTGFFGETVDRGMLDRTYYVGVGCGAYRGAAGALGVRGPDNPFRGLFVGLAQRFVELMHLLNEVSERVFGRDADVVRVYDRYLATGSEKLAARLARMGILVGPTKVVC